MSTLTKEEMEYLEDVRERDPDDCRLLIIDRFVAENEELRRDAAHNFSQQVADAITKDAAITDYNQQIERLQAKLTALIEAAEPIEKRLQDELPLYKNETETEKMNISIGCLNLGDLRNLNKAVKEAKGE